MSPCTASQPAATRRTREQIQRTGRKHETTGERGAAGRWDRAGYLRGADEHVAAAVYAASFLLLSITFTATNSWSARRRLWHTGISSEEMSQQLSRASIGLVQLGQQCGQSSPHRRESLMIVSKHDTHCFRIDPVVKRSNFQDHLIGICLTAR